LLFLFETFWGRTVGLGQLEQFGQSVHAEFGRVVGFFGELEEEQFSIQ
jgi:hypothetical protein